MPKVLSLAVPTAFSSVAQKLGQPVPLSNSSSTRRLEGRTRAGECASSLVAGQWTREGTLGRLVSQHLILIGRQPFPPLGVAVRHLEGRGRGGRRGAPGEADGARAYLAEARAVSLAEISAIETGWLVPSVAVALRLASALGESVETLFGGTGSPAEVVWAWSPRSSTDCRVASICQGPTSDIPGRTPPWRQTLPRDVPS